MKLNQFKEKFNQKHLRKQTAQKQPQSIVEQDLFDEMALSNEVSADVKREYMFLHDHLADVFPFTYETVKTMVDSSPYMDYLKGQERPNDVYTAEYLPFHLVDSNWVAKYVMNVMQAKNPHQKLTFENVKAYVEHSVHFEVCRNKYEDDIVKAQITYMMDHDKPNGLMPYYNPQMAKPLGDWDMQFREQARRALGFTARLHPYSVEVGLERHADLWRPQTMDETFEDLYQRQQKWIDLDQPDLDQTKQAEFKANYKAAWMKQREHSYYHSHKRVIDELGTATANMRMSGSEAFNACREVVFYEGKHFHAYREAYKNVKAREAAAEVCQNVVASNPTQSNELSR